MLDGDDAAGREALAVAGAVNLVEYRNGGVARADEVGVQAVADAVLDGPIRGDERLRDDLAAEDALHAIVGRLAAEKVHLDALQIEQRDEVCDRIFREGGGIGHGQASVGVGLPVFASQRPLKRQWRQV